MTNNWTETTLGKLGTIITGKTPSTKREDYFGGSVPFVTPKDMNGRKIISSTERYLTQAGVEAVKNSLLPANAVMVSCIGSDMGKVAIAGRECVTNQQINSIIVNEAVCPDYVYYDLSYRQIEIKSKSSGSAVPILNKGHFEQLQIGLPPLPEQKAIAHILGTLDDKIELNRRMNETLEQIARVIFKSWFVDFEFPNSEGKPYKSSGGEMIDSELGEIPKGWKVNNLGDILELAYGKALKEEERRTGSVPVFGSNGQVGWHNKKLVEGPGIIVGRKGNPGIVTWAHTDFFAIDTTFFVLPRSPEMSLHFLFYALHDQNLPSIAADSAVPGLNRNLAYMSQQIVPSVEILRLFDKLVESLYAKMNTNEIQSHTLAALRDTLLPKLLSGEIRIQDAENFLKERGL